MTAFLGIGQVLTSAATDQRCSLMVYRDVSIYVEGAVHDARLRSKMVFDGVEWLQACLRLDSPQKPRLSEHR